MGWSLICFIIPARKLAHSGRGVALTGLLAALGTFAALPAVAVAAAARRTVLAQLCALNAFIAQTAFAAFAAFSAFTVHRAVFALTRALAARQGGVVIEANLRRGRRQQTLALGKRCCRCFRAGAVAAFATALIAASVATLTAFATTPLTASFASFRPRLALAIASGIRRCPLIARLAWFAWFAWFCGRRA